ncbi:MAG: hypothetical protein JKY86_13880 [Gammaproteobacteria bacterium]|nr:hypothetical protein [Gammaproteobacteria bacterium]
MNRILQKLTALLPCSTETNRKVFSLLNEIRDLGGKVTLLDTDSGRSYRCRVPALSAGHRVFVVTGLSPLKEAYSTLQSSRLTVVVTNGSQSYNLSCTLMGPLLPDHSMGYQLKFKNLCNETRQGRAFNLLQRG